MQRHFILFCLCILLCAVLPSVFAKSDTKKLVTIQNLISETKKSLERNLADSERLQQELKLAELTIAETATQLNQTDRLLSKTQDEQKALTKEQGDIQQNISRQQQALASQLRSAYMAGDYDFAKMIFSQEKASQFERVLTYYQYLNQARQTEIQSFKMLIEKLKKVQNQLSEKEVQLSALKSKQASQAQELRSLQQARYVSLQKLEQQIVSEQERVNTLTQQENDLLTAIERAEQAARNSPKNLKKEDLQLTGLSSLKGKLKLPTSGKLQRLFGKRRQGQVRWKGVVINTRSGTEVTAVADGIILYADWLKGFGLVTIVDHGEGYMSVYGRNQALLKSAGDAVLAGEAISLAGTSGGQSSASLYFEIRHKGKALNPSSWLTKS